MNEDIEKQHTTNGNIKMINRKAFQSSVYLQKGKAEMNVNSFPNKYSSQTIKVTVSINKEHITDVYSYGQEDVRWLAEKALQR